MTIEQTDRRAERAANYRATVRMLDERVAQRDAEAAANVRAAYQTGMALGVVVCVSIVAGFLAIVFRVAGWW